MKLELKATLSEAEHLAASEFLAASSHAHVWQSPEALPIYLHSGRTAYHVVATDGGALACYGVLYVDRHKREAFCLRGPVFETAEAGRVCLELLRAELRRRGVGQMRVSPYWDGAEAHALSAVLTAARMRPYSARSPFQKSGRVSLEGTFEDLLARFAKQTRKELGRCSRAGFVLQPVEDTETASAAYSLFDSLKRRKALTPMPRPEFDALSARILRHPEAGAMVIARMDGRMVGARWVIRVNRSVAMGIVYAIDSEFMRASFRSHSIGVPLWVEGMKWAQANGCQWFDVEGYSPDTPEDSPLHSVHQFKGQFRPEPVEILTEHAGICHRPRYAMYEIARQWRRLLRIPKKLRAGRLTVMGH